MTIARLGLCLLLVGCSYSREKFEEDYPEDYCALVMSCDPPFENDLDECIRNVADDTPAAECEYDHEAAAACRDALTGLQCVGSASNYPTVCDQVYTCP
jgi:excinuclease UvrABC nuclease subunit